jgi:hypothetical protein
MEILDAPLSVRLVAGDHLGLLKGDVVTPHSYGMRVNERLRIVQDIMSRTTVQFCVDFYVMLIPGHTSTLPDNAPRLTFALGSIESWAVCRHDMLNIGNTDFQLVCRSSYLECAPIHKHRKHACLDIFLLQ